MTAVFLAYSFLVMNPMSEPMMERVAGGMRMPDTAGLYSLEYVLELFRQLGHEGVRYYRHFTLLYDGIFPVLYTGLYVVWLSLLLRHATPEGARLRGLNLFPLAAMFADYIENSLEMMMATSYLDDSTIEPGVHALAVMFSGVKWTLVILNFLLLLFAIYKWIRSRRSSPA